MTFSVRNVNTGAVYKVYGIKPATRDFDPSNPKHSTGHDLQFLVFDTKWKWVDARYLVPKGD